MTRPEGIPDPRDPDAPIRVDDPKEDAARSNVTVGELAREALDRGEPMDAPMEPLELPEIDSERWAYLRRRRDEILAELRERGLPDGG